MPTDDPDLAAVLISLWGCLENAAEIATAADVLDHVGELEALCEDAMQYVRRLRRLER